MDETYQYSNVLIHCTDLSNFLMIMYEKKTLRKQKVSSEFLFIKFRYELTNI